MQDMYKGMVNSPETTITNNISNSDTLIYVLDPTRVPSELPNTMTLGTSSNAETVKVLSMDGSALTVERGFQGTPIAWNVGTIIGRNFTEYDYEALRINVSDLESTDENKGASLVKIHDADGNFISDNVEGALKENAAGISEVNLSLNTHKLDLITDTDGAHGLKYEKGNWTPVLKVGTNVSNYTYTSQVGKYIKINNMVTVMFEIIIATKGVATGQLIISGLPFNVSEVGVGGALPECLLAYPSGATEISMRGLGNYLELWGNGTNFISYLTETAVRTDTYLRGQIMYITN